MFNKRKYNQGVWTPTCIKNYHPTIFQQILEEGVPQIQSNNNEINNGWDSDDISELSTLLNTDNKTWHPIIPYHGEWQFNQTEVQLKLQLEKQRTKTKERPWIMSDNAKPFEPQRRVHIFQPNHNTTKTQIHNNQTIGVNRQNKKKT